MGTSERSVALVTFLICITFSSIYAVPRGGGARELFIHSGICCPGEGGNSMNFLAKMGTSERSVALVTFLICITFSSIYAVPRGGGARELFIHSGICCPGEGGNSMNFLAKMGTSERSVALVTFLICITFSSIYAVPRGGGARELFIHSGICCPGEGGNSMNFLAKMGTSERSVALVTFLICITFSSIYAVPRGGGARELFIHSGICCPGEGGNSVNFLAKMGTSERSVALVTFLICITFSSIYAVPRGGGARELFIHSGICCPGEGGNSMNFLAKMGTSERSVALVTFLICITFSSIYAVPRGGGARELFIHSGICCPGEGGNSMNFLAKMGTSERSVALVTFLICITFSSIYAVPRGGGARELFIHSGICCPGEGGNSMNFLAKMGTSERSVALVTFLICITFSSIYAVPRGGGARELFIHSGICCPGEGGNSMNFLAKMGTSERSVALVTFLICITFSSIYAVPRGGGARELFIHSGICCPGEGGNSMNFLAKMGTSERSVALVTFLICITFSSIYAVPRGGGARELFIHSGICCPGEGGNSVNFLAKMGTSERSVALVTFLICITFSSIYAVPRGGGARELFIHSGICCPGEGGNSMNFLAKMGTSERSVALVTFLICITFSSIYAVPRGGGARELFIHSGICCPGEGGNSMNFLAKMGTSERSVALVTFLICITFSSIYAVPRGGGARELFIHSGICCPGEGGNSVNFLAKMGTSERSVALVTFLICITFSSIYAVPRGGGARELFIHSGICCPGEGGNSMNFLAKMGTSERSVALVTFLICITFSSIYAVPRGGGARELFIHSGICCPGEGGNSVNFLAKMGTSERSVALVTFLICITFSSIYAVPRGGGARELFIHSGICCPGEGGNSVNFLAKMGTSERSVALVTFLICITFSSIYAVPRGGGARELFIHSGICCPGEGGNSMNFLAKMGTSERSVALVTFLICITFSSIYAVPRGGGARELFIHSGICCPGEGGNSMNFLAKMGTSERSVALVTFLICITFSSIYAVPRGGGARELFIHSGICCPGEGGNSVNFLAKMGTSERSVALVTFLICITFSSIYAVPRGGGARARAFHTFWHLLPWGGWQLHEFSCQNGHVWKICSTCHIFDLHNFFEYICRAEGGAARASFSYILAFAALGRVATPWIFLPKWARLKDL
uniref:2dab4d6d-3058-421d-80a4-841bcba4f660-CDS n=1 Tax=Plasmodiophora brassicae TaxID=37360 RepID=A0A3P3YWC9_PLABS|nr:2dab4d6d-3058-421d-80a4-841bcba4f660-CDS [Plasmodiophora brassicae]